MAALVFPSSSAPSRPARTGTPHLVVLPGGRAAVRRQRSSARRSRRVYLRRRVVAVAAVLLTGWAAVQLLVVTAGWVGSRFQPAATEIATTDTAGAAPAALAPRAAPAAAVPAPAASEVYVVQPGDTLWRIASALRPESDPRDVVRVLQQRAGGSVVHPGQRIDIADLP